MQNKTWLFIFILITFFSIQAFSREKKFSIQTSPLFLVNDIAYLSADNDWQTNVVLADLEFQFAVSRYFNISLTYMFYFENYMDSYLEDSRGRYDEKYGQQYQCMIMPALIYRPFGKGLKGMFISAYPIAGYSYVSTEYLDDSFAHLGAGFRAGYQWVFKQGFTIQLGMGADKTWTIASEDNKGTYREKDEWHYADLPFDLGFTFRLGYSF